MRRPWPVTIAVLALAAALLTGCGGGSHNLGKQPVIGEPGTHVKAGEELGFPSFATKNTTRVGGSDGVADAAAVAQAVFPAGSPGTRPMAVVLADKSQWAQALAASVLMSAPVHAPLLYSDGGSLPAASSDTLKALAPTGSTSVAGSQVIRIGNAPKPPKLRSTKLAGRAPAVVAASIARLQAAAAGKPPPAVVVVSQDDPAYAMPAAAWAAKSGDPILFAHRTSLPVATVKSLRELSNPHIYVLGPVNVVSDTVLRRLSKIATTRRIAGADPVASSVAFARYSDRAFGWHVVDPGHGLVFASEKRPLDAAAAAPLSASGTYGPLVLLDKPAPLNTTVEGYLLDIQPGYSQDPVRGVYNHGWLIGDTSAIAITTQSRIDSLLEIAPVKAPTSSSP